MEKDEEKMNKRVEDKREAEEEKHIERVAGLEKEKQEKETVKGLKHTPYQLLSRTGTQRLVAKVEEVKSRQCEIEPWNFAPC